MRHESGNVSVSMWGGIECVASLTQAVHSVFTFMGTMQKKRPKLLMEKFPKYVNATRKAAVLPCNVLNVSSGIIL